MKIRLLLILSLCLFNAGCYEDAYLEPSVLKIAEDKCVKNNGVSHIWYHSASGGWFRGSVICNDGAQFHFQAKAREKNEG